MKLDKVRFATLIGYISRAAGVTFSVSEIVEIDDIINMPIPEPAEKVINIADLHTLMALMQEGSQTIAAIKAYRALTGVGLKESKDVVEKYWPDYSILSRVADALGTEEKGQALVEVARNAHRAEQELASQHNDEGATLGDILDKAKRSLAED